MADEYCPGCGAKLPHEGFGYGYNPDYPDYNQPEAAEAIFTPITLTTAPLLSPIQLPEGVPPEALGVMSPDEPDEDLNPEPLFLEDLARVHLEPGDVLVLMMDNDPGIGHRQYWQGRLKEIWPGHEVLVLTEGMRLGVLSKSADLTPPESTS